MRKALPLFLACLATAALAGCESAAVRGVQRDIQQVQREAGSLWRGPGDAEYNAGIRQYENGSYGDAYRNLQAALGKGLRWDADKVQAYKYLAFMDCAAGRERACRENFARALALDPAMELTPAEAGHPVWGPVFRNVKAGR